MGMCQTPRRQGLTQEEDTTRPKHDTVRNATVRRDTVRHDMERQGKKILHGKTRHGTKGQMKVNVAIFNRVSRIADTQRVR